VFEFSKRSGKRHTEGDTVLGLWSLISKNKKKKTTKAIYTLAQEPPMDFPFWGPGDPTEEGTRSPRKTRPGGLRERGGNGAGRERVPCETSFSPLFHRPGPPLPVPCRRDDDARGVL